MTVMKARELTIYDKGYKHVWLYDNANDSNNTWGASDLILCVDNGTIARLTPEQAKQISDICLAFWERYAGNNNG
jgi:hypothetical protein